MLFYNRKQFYYRFPLSFQLISQNPLDFLAFFYKTTITSFDCKRATTWLGTTSRFSLNHLPILILPLHTWISLRTLFAVFYGSLWILFLLVPCARCARAVTTHRRPHQGSVLHRGPFSLTHQGFLACHLLLYDAGVEESMVVWYKP